MQWSIVFIVLSIVHICTINGQCAYPDLVFCNFIDCGNGTCVADLNLSQCFVCRCPAVYTGQYCETQIAPPSPCGSPCQNGGQCQLVATNVYACICPSDFTGSQCETPVSTSHVCTVAPQAACKNGGTCIVAGQGYLCQCAYGWTGASCETQDPTLRCPDNFCLSGGTCQLNGNAMSCQCPPTHTGARCETVISMTTSTTPLITITSPTTSPVSCTPNPCLNGGTCYDLGNNFVCACPPTHAGSTCDISLTTSTMPVLITTTSNVGPTINCASNPCLNGGKCFDSGNSFVCVCPPTHAGSICDVSLTSSTMPVLTTTTTSNVGPTINCTSRPCLNGGSCFNTANSFFCSCKVGYTGQTCHLQTGPTTIAPSTAPTISSCALNPCNNGGSCYKYGNSFICVCTQYYTGDTCNAVRTFTTTAVTTPSLTITCANQPCQNGGTCYTTSNTYFCFCGSTSMYTGKNCETPTATIDANCPLNCSPGYCVRAGNNNNAYACMCNGVLTPTSCRN